MTEQIEVTLVKSKIKKRPYCKVDGTYAGPTWKNDIGLQHIPLDIQAMYNAALKLQDLINVCMVYGHAIRPTIANTDRTMTNFDEAPTHLLTLDLDKYERGFNDEYPTQDEIIKVADTFIHTHLPPEFQNTSYILRLSSSFLTKSLFFRSHIIFLLEVSQFPREIGTWIKREKIPVDPTFYFNLTQPIFTAAPLFTTQVDPLKKISPDFPRVILVRKDKDLVPEGWQPYYVPEKIRSEFAEMPEANELPGKIGSFCRMMTVASALSQLGYEDHGDGRFLSPTSETGLPGAKVFGNGYCFSHHSDDPIALIRDQIYGGKRDSFNTYDLMHGWAKVNLTKDPTLMTQFEYLLAESTMSDQQYQDEVVGEFIFRTEWLIEDGYTGENKLIVDSLLYDISSAGLNQMSRNYVLDMINVKTAKKIKKSDLNNAWKYLKKDSAFYKNEYDPDAGLRTMASIFMKKGIVYSHHGGLRGDFWCYYKSTRMWRRLNRDQTNAYIYRHLHEAMPLKKEIPLHKVEDLTRLILQLISERYSRFKPGKGWAFKGGKVGIIMTDLFKKKWKTDDNIKTLKKEYRIYRELPVTYEQWKSNNGMPPKFNDFLLSSTEEDYEKIDLIQEFMGYIFADSYYLHNFMVLEGVPGSGKSILIKIIRASISSRFFTAISLGRMGGQFGLGELPGKKLAVMSEAREINFNQLRAAVPVILKMVGNDPIDIEAKHKMGTTELLDAKLMIVTNRTPVMPDDTGALTQRMIMLRLHKSFRGTDEEILGLDEEILGEEIPSIVRWSLKGLERLAKRKQFKVAQSIMNESVYYREQLDPLKTFIEQYFTFEQNEDAVEGKWIRGSEFTEHFREYLFRIGQNMPITKVQKRASVPVLRNLDKRLTRLKIRDGPDTYAVIYPLVPKMDLEEEYRAERSELANLNKEERHENKSTD